MTADEGTPLDPAADPAPRLLPATIPDPAALSCDLTAALRGVPGIADVYAPRSAVLLVAQHVVEEVVSGGSTAADQLVTVEAGDHGVRVQASVAVDAAERASDTARAAVDALRARLAETVGADAAAAAAITVRVGSIG